MVYSLSLQVSDFIMVPVTKIVERPMESRSPQSSQTDLESKNDMSLYPTSLGAIPAWDNTTKTSPTEGALNLQIVFDNVIASQGNSRHVENAIGHAVSVLESLDASNPPFSLLDLQLWSRPIK